MMPRGGTGPADAMSPRPFDVPQTWYEWWASIFDTDHYTLEVQRYGCTVAVNGGANGQANTIQVPEPCYVFGIDSQGIVNAGAGTGTPGAFPPFPYRIGWKVANGNDWTSGQWFCTMITGDQSAGGLRPRRFEWPRYLATNEIVTVTVDNAINVAGTPLTVDATLYCYVTRQLREAVRRK